MSITSDLYLDKWSQFAKKETDWANEGPRNIYDNRVRVRRETMRGKTTLFHETFEDYLERQLRMYTLPRATITLSLLSIMTLRYYQRLVSTFSNFWKYKSLKRNPIYVKLGPSTTAFYVLRPIICAYLALRVAKLWLKIAYLRWEGEKHETFEIAQEENTYDTWFKDMRDFRMVNFRYSDHDDTKAKWSAYNPDTFKAEADYYKGLYNFFRKGEDSYFTYFTHWDFKH